MSKRNTRRKRNAKAIRIPGDNGAAKTAGPAEEQEPVYDLAVVFRCACGAFNACVEPPAVKAAFERGSMIRLGCRACGKTPERRPSWAPKREPLIIPATRIPTRIVKG